MREKAKFVNIVFWLNFLNVFGFCSATVTNLQQKLEGLTTTNALMKEDLAIAKNNILQLQQENSELRSENETLSEQIRKQLQVTVYFKYHGNGNLTEIS